MISKEEMIKVIYEKMTDKTLMVWNKIIRLLKNWEGKEDIILEKKSEVLYRTDLWYLHLKDNSWDYEIKNPVMIWDVLDYIYINKDKLFFQWDMDMQNFASYFSVSIWWLLEKWEYKRKPLEMQSNDCIECIYNLF